MWVGGLLTGGVWHLPACVPEPISARVGPEGELFGSILWAPHGRMSTAWGTRGGCTCRYAYGQGVRSSQEWPPLLSEVWRGVSGHLGDWLPPGSSEPNSANLNWYSDTRCEGLNWHSDNEPLFGQPGLPRLIVSVSFGSPRLFQIRLRRRGPPLGSCELGHCDLAVMDGLAQDLLDHRVAPGGSGWRLNVTFRWVKVHDPEVCELGRRRVAAAARLARLGLASSDLEMPRPGFAGGASPGQQRAGIGGTLLPGSGQSPPHAG